MPHLVDSVSADRSPEHGVLTVPACAALVREAHAFIVKQGREAVERASVVGDRGPWGTAMKRTKVELPKPGRPRLVEHAPDAHSLAEVVNQCATMERLLDALAWIATDSSGMAAWRVAICHPTTGSARVDAEGSAPAIDADLVLRGPQDELARFEVSDVASKVDGNRKEEHDLRALGLLRDGRGDERVPAEWPAGRAFLVVSAEFAEGLAKRRWAHFGYEHHDVTAVTTVLEVVRKSV